MTAQNLKDCSGLGPSLSIQEARSFAIAWSSMSDTHLKTPHMGLSGYIAWNKLIPPGFGTVCIYRDTRHVCLGTHISANAKAIRDSGMASGESAANKA